MKKIYLFAAATLALASCTSDEFFGNSESKNESNVIGFGTFQAKTTRTGELTGKSAAEKLNNNFVVYGFKYTTSEAVSDATTDQPVFDLYNVNYTEGTANTTESNTAGWEYVGYTPHTGSSATETAQSIKYWDYSAAGYVFSAVSGTGITAVKTKTTSGTSVYDKGWEVTIPAGGSLSDLYASNRVPVAKADYQKQVNLTFYNLATKIRFAMYETVPGYSIQIKKFYYKGTYSESNFGVDGNFKTLNKDTESKLTVTYYDGSGSTIENRPKVTVAEADVPTVTSGEFGTNIQPTEKIGTTSVEATYDQADKSYTDILPMQGNGMELKVDYTLTSTDGNGEVINVYGATAKVPANFTNWKENFAYTYLFKISDNTNGKTEEGGSVEGLYPITFDAVVVNAEDGIQETITSVSDPSITTYQEGVVVTKTDEYKAGVIYFENDTKNIADYHVYEVNNLGTEATTEEVVANWAKNFCVLTEVEVVKSTADELFIPLSDGTFLKKGANEAGKFLAAAGKTYVIADAALDASVAPVTPAHYKVVKVTGNPAAVEYALTPASSTISKVTGDGSYAVLSLTGDSKAVLGAVPCFKVTKGGVASNNLVFAPGTTDGSYVVTVAPAAIAAGTANGDYSVEFEGKKVTITVSIAYVLRNAADDADVTDVTIVAGNTTGAIVINKIAGAAADGDVTEVPAGITVEKTATGTYKITAAATLATGAYVVKIANQTLTVNVDSYAFLSNLVIDKPYNSTTKTGILTLQKNGATATGVTTLTGGDDAVATYTATDGVYTYTAKAGGSFDVTYENAKAKVTVNEYSLVSTNDAIASSTGSATLTLKLKNSSAAAHAINAVASKVAVAAYDFESNAIASPNYTLTTNGQNLIFKAVTKGNYSFTYIESGEYVAQIIIRVE